MKILAAILTFSVLMTCTVVAPAHSQDGAVRYYPKSKLSRCIAKAKKKKGAFARNKAIRACYAKK